MLDARQIPAADARRLAEHYRRALLDDFVPWWERHSIDRQCGGFHRCLERDLHGQGQRGQGVFPLAAGVPTKLPAADALLRR